MTFINIKKRIASNIGYVDSSGDLLASKDITATDLDNWINDRYIDDLFSILSSQYPEDFTQLGRLNFYKTTGTVSSSSTSTTLVATGNIFNNGMVGDRVYNSTDDELAEITAYTAATTVTLDTTIGDDWDGDTIYVLGHEFGLGGNATDLRSILRVSVKYDSDDDNYTTCRYSSKSKLLQDGDENYYESSPVWYPTTVDISSVPTTAIGILPEASKNVTSGIEIEYIEQPSAMSSDSDVPRLPLGAHSTLVFGGTADALRKLMRLDEADRFEQLYQAGKQEMITSYLLTRGSGVPKVTPSRRLRRMVDRDR
jgi:hypothetical protein